MFLEGPRQALNNAGSPPAGSPSAGQTAGSCASHLGGGLSHAGPMTQSWVGVTVISPGAFFSPCSSEDLTQACQCNEMRISAYL